MKACAIAVFAFVSKFALITLIAVLRATIELGLHILNVQPVETRHPPPATLRVALRAGPPASLYYEALRAGPPHCYTKTVENGE